MIVNNMGKTETTILIEKKLIKRFLQTSTRFALEVPIGKGIADCVTADISYQKHHIPIITCWEIKTSWSDFKSKNGHNFVGDKNYYVLQEELYQLIREKQKNEFFSAFGDCGVYVLTKRGALKLVVEDRTYRTKLTIDCKFGVLDNILIKWESGTMYRELKSHNIKMRNQ